MEKITRGSARLKFRIVASAVLSFTALWLAAAFSEPRQAIATHSPSPPGSNIVSSTPNYWGWNDIVGWIDFHTPDTLIVKDDRIEGFASSSAGEIAFDCNTAPGGSGCSGGFIAGTPGHYRVFNDGCGALSGWAWNDTYGWISLSGANHPGVGFTSYGVTIGSSNGEFLGWAWNDVIGWISVNCLDIGCGQNYKVVTTWRAVSTAAFLDSSVIDTGVPGGVQLNSIMWNGRFTSGGCSGGLGSSLSVSFQIAVGNTPSGAWTADFKGPSGTSSDYFLTSGPGRSTSLAAGSYNGFSGYRYFRYRVRLTAGPNQTPVVDEVIINYSP